MKQLKLFKDKKQRLAHGGTIATLIARQVTKARRGKPFGKFWSFLIFSRLLTSWRGEFEIVKAYIEKNTLEATGAIRYVPRKGQRYVVQTLRRVGTHNQRF